MESLSGYSLCFRQKKYWLVTFILKHTLNKKEFRL